MVSVGICHRATCTCVYWGITRLPEDALGKEKLDKSKEIEQLAEWIATVRDMENYYIFFGNEYSGDPVRDARELHKQLLNRDIVAQGFQPEISLLDFI